MISTELRFSNWKFMPNLCLFTPILVKQSLSMDVFFLFLFLLFVNFNAFVTAPVSTVTGIKFHWTSFFALSLLVLHFYNRKEWKKKKIKRGFFFFCYDIQFIFSEIRIKKQDEQQKKIQLRRSLTKRRK